MTSTVQIVLAIAGWLTVVGVARSIAETRKAKWRAMECRRHRNEVDPDIAAVKPSLRDSHVPPQRATKDDVR